MNLLRCIFGKNDCFKTGKFIKPKGVMVHSTGANNPMLRRYVQPMVGYADYSKLMSLLGDNPNNNDWNRPGLKVCVHGFIGKLADGTVATVQTLPWDMRGWHSGTGTSGKSANDTHISFEICEDGLTDRKYFESVYREAVELTAMLCLEHDLDPMKPGVVICHSEGYKRGIASNHGDVMHWFPKHGKDMDDFRKDVALEMEEQSMTQEKFNEMMDVYLAQQAKKAPSAWSAKARAWAEKLGIVKGTGNQMEYKRPVTREEVAEMLYRFSQK